MISTAIHVRLNNDLLGFFPQLLLTAHTGLRVGLVPFLKIIEVALICALIDVLLKLVCLWPLRTGGPILEGNLDLAEGG